MCTMNLIESKENNHKKILTRSFMIRFNSYFWERKTREKTSVEEEINDTNEQKERDDEREKSRYDETD